MKNDLISKIEAVLFYLAEPVSLSFLSKTLEVSKAEVSKALIELEKTLENRGVKIVLHDDEVTLSTSPQYSQLIEKIIKEERERDLGRAGIETLSIIAYKGPVAKKDIEYIRGVNSQYALRNLLLRGLIERKNSIGDSRSVVYSITADTLRHLGLGHIEELPEYEEMKKQLDVSSIQEENIETEEHGGE